MGSRFSSRRSSSGAKISNTVRVFGASRLGKRQEAFLCGILSGGAHFRCDRTSGQQRDSRKYPRTQGLLMGAPRRSRARLLN
jgi:hypothetical protein